MMRHAKFPQQHPERDQRERAQPVHREQKEKNAPPDEFGVEARQPRVGLRQFQRVRVGLSHVGSVMVGRARSRGLSNWEKLTAGSFEPPASTSYAGKNQRPIFLKQTLRLPGIARDDMKTISEQLTVRRSFKQAQLLPVLTPEMTVAPGGVAALRGVWPKTEPMRIVRRTTQRSATARLPGPRSSESRAERLLFSLLALSAAAAIGYALAVMIELSLHWPTFTAWAAHVLG